MSRPPRLTYPGAVHHVTLRCNNREFLFEPSSLQLFEGLLRGAREKLPLLLYNYCLMTNHVHLLFEVGRDDTLSMAMHWLSTSFTRRFNRLAGRNGHVWEGRFRSTIIEASSYFLRCMAYVDLNPVRAGLAAAPVDYGWNGHAALQAQDASVLDFHPLYLECGGDPASRYGSYAEILAQESARPPFTLATEYFVGSMRFVRRMERRFGFASARKPLEHREFGSGIVSAGRRRGRPVYRP